MDYLIISMRLCYFLSFFSFCFILLFQPSILLRLAKYDKIASYWVLVYDLFIDTVFSRIRSYLILLLIIICISNSDISVIRNDNCKVPRFIDYDQHAFERMDFFFANY